MRDVIKIFAAGSILSAYALLTPTMVEAVPGAAGPQKAFTQRLSEAGGEAPVSAVSGTLASRMAVAPRNALPRFALYESLR